MSLDPEVKNAIKRVVKRLEQPEAVGRRLVAWLSEKSERHLSPSDEMKHLEGVREAIRIDVGQAK